MASGIFFEKKTGKVHPSVARPHGGPDEAAPDTPSTGTVPPPPLVRAAREARETFLKPRGLPAFYSRRKKRGNQICQILIRSGDVKPQHVRRALRIQEERGGQIGRILITMGACTERALARALTTQVRLAHEAGEAKNLSNLARQNPAIAGLEVRASPVLTSLMLATVDITVLAVIGALASGCDLLVAKHVSQSLLHYGFSALLLCVIVQGTLNTYAATATNPPDEIRNSTLALSLIFLCEGLVAMLGHELIPWHVHTILFFEWALCTVCLPIARTMARHVFARQPWWGVAVVVLGAGRTGRALVRALQMNPHLGLRPVLILDDDAKKHGTLRASLVDARDIQVDSIRDVPMHSVAQLEVESTHFIVEPPPPPPPPQPSSPGAPALFAPPPRAPGEEEPSTIRSPSSLPPGLAPESDAGPTRDRPSTPRLSQFPAVAPTSASAVADPAPRTPSPAAPSTPRVAEAERADPSAVAGPMSVRHFAMPASVRPRSSRDLPAESLRGHVRGQFAEVEGVPVIGGVELAPLLATRLKISWAIIAMPGQNSRKLLDVTERIGGAFTRLLLIPDLMGFATMGVPSREVGGVLGLEVRQQLLLPGPRLAKRMIDLVLSSIGGIFIVPIILFIALLIRLDSKGGAFYPQKRLGRDGTPFTARKFRTMHGDGESRLRAVLDADPKLRAEYDEFHKLSFDPRVTRVGRILRKYSLDELPQVFNVLRGEMSLVGPRPYLEREIPEMDRKEGIILRAMPGMTGLWQVSDRNSTGFQERLKMDVHYVRNWSPWLDLYILARTAGVVIAGTGS